MEAKRDTTPVFSFTWVFTAIQNLVVSETSLCLSIVDVTSLTNLQNRINNLQNTLQAAPPGLFTSILDNFSTYLDHSPADPAESGCGLSVHYS